jgi:LPPG:FO 2-phospho-L-lactate transferase
VVLAGGTGGAALAAAIQERAPEHRLTVIANTADDDDFWGLRVCPDVDAVLYRLAGIFNDAAGYGIKADTFKVLEALRWLREDVWFQIGDRDFATHLVRTEMLRRGATLTEATLELCHRFDIQARVLPMSDDIVRTRFRTDQGDLSFQEYFVRERLKPKLLGITFAAPQPARATHAVVDALQDADTVVIGPSNPLISIDPILEVARDSIPRDRTVAVTPLVAGAALKGPTVEMMRALGLDATPVAIARRYTNVASRFILDERDRELSDEIEALGYRVSVCDTVMRDGGSRLAGAVLGPT